MKKQLNATKSGIKLSSKKQRKESWLPEDEEWIDERITSNKPITFSGTPIAKGGRGTVYNVRNNSKLVIKIPRGYDGEQLEDWHLKLARKELREENDEYNKHNFNSVSLFTPSRAIVLPGKTPSGGEYIGIIRPKVTPIVDFAKGVSVNTIKKLTSQQIEAIRLKVIEISRLGYIVTDGLQIGLDRKGNPIMYDLGNIIKENDIDIFTIRSVEQENQQQWLTFLRLIGKTGLEKELLSKYGKIEVD